MDHDLTRQSAEDGSITVDYGGSRLVKRELPAQKASHFTPVMKNRISLEMFDRITRLATHDLSKGITQGITSEEAVDDLPTGECYRIIGPEAVRVVANRLYQAGPGQFLRGWIRKMIDLLAPEVDLRTGSRNVGDHQFASATEILQEGDLSPDNRIVISRCEQANRAIRTLESSLDVSRIDRCLTQVEDCSLREAATGKDIAGRPQVQIDCSGRGTAIGQRKGPLLTAGDRRRKSIGPRCRDIGGRRLVGSRHELIIDQREVGIIRRARYLDRGRVRVEGDCEFGLDLALELCGEGSVEGRRPLIVRHRVLNRHRGAAIGQRKGPLLTAGDRRRKSIGPRCRDIGGRRLVGSRHELIIDQREVGIIRRARYLDRGRVRVEGDCEFGLDLALELCGEGSVEGRRPLIVRHRVLNRHRGPSHPFHPDNEAVK